MRRLFQITKTVLILACQFMFILICVVNTPEIFLWIIGVIFLFLFIFESATGGRVLRDMMRRAKEDEFSFFYWAHAGVVHSNLKNAPLPLKVLDIVAQACFQNIFIFYAELARRRAMQEERWMNIS